MEASKGGYWTTQFLAIYSSIRLKLALNMICKFFYKKSIWYVNGNFVILVFLYSNKFKGKAKSFFFFLIERKKEIVVGLGDPNNQIKGMLLKRICCLPGSFHFSKNKVFILIKSSTWECHNTRSKKSPKLQRNRERWEKWVKNSMDNIHLIIKMGITTLISLT